MNTEFIKDRITKLRLIKNISEREMSLSLGKAHNYIQSISSGRIIPTLESILDICDYLDVTPSTFFDSELENPILINEVLNESNRISNNNLEAYLEILKLFDPADFESYLKRLNKYHEVKGKK